jgi:hypothetical protein
MERKTVAALGGTATLGLVLGGITLDGVSINLAGADPVLVLAILLGLALAALVGFMILSLVKGWVIIKLHYDTVLNTLTTRAEKAEAANERLSDRQMILTETNRTLVSSIEKTTAVGETVTKLVHSIQDARIDAGGTP